MKLRLPFGCCLLLLLLWGCKLETIEFQAPMPIEGVTVSQVSVSGCQLSWPLVEGATEYLLDVATDPAFENRHADYSDRAVRQSRLWMANLMPQTRYYVRLRVNHPQHGMSAYTKAVVFETKLLTQPVLLEPTSLSPTGAALRWVSAQDGLEVGGLSLYYIMDVATDPDFNNILPNYKQVRISDVRTQLGLSPYQDHYVRVRCVLGDKASAYSPALKVGNSTLYYSQRLYEMRFVFYGQLVGKRVFTYDTQNRLKTAYEEDLSGDPTVARILKEFDFSYGTDGQLSGFVCRNRANGAQVYRGVVSREGNNRLLRLFTALPDGGEEERLITYYVLLHPTNGIPYVTRKTEQVVQPDGSMRMDKDIAVRYDEANSANTICQYKVMGGNPIDLKLTFVADQLMHFYAHIDMTLVPFFDVPFIDRDGSVKFSTYDVLPNLFVPRTIITETGGYIHRQSFSYDANAAAFPSKYYDAGIRMELSYQKP